MEPAAAHCRVKSEEGDVQIAARPLHFIGKVSEAEVGEKCGIIITYRKRNAEVFCFPLFC